MGTFGARSPLCSSAPNHASRSPGLIYWRLLASHLPSPARGLFAAAAAILLAPSVLYREALPRVLVRPIQDSRVLRVLQDLHSGHVGDYTAWLLAGVVGIGGFMAAVGTGH